MEEEEKVARPAYQIGQNLSTFSVEDLNRTIELLKQEIVRLEQELKSKQTSKVAAESLFRRE